MKDLYELIHKLTSRERADFKKMANRQKGEKTFVKIFDAHVKLKKYDKATLAKKFKNEASAGSIHVYENYSYNQVLQSLISTSKKSLSEFKINQLISEADILERKGLYDQAMKRLKKAEKEARTFHVTQSLLSILQRMITLTVAKEARDRSERINALFDEADKVREALNEEWILSRLYRTVLNRYRETGNQALTEYPKVIESALRHPVTQKSNEELTFYSTYFKSSLLGIIAKMKSDRPNMTKHYDDLMALWQNNPKIRAEQPHTYRIILSNYISNCCDLSRWENVESGLAELKKLPTRDFNDEAEHFQNVAFFELYYLINTCRFEQAVKLVPEVEKGLERYEEKINEARMINFLYLITLLYFITENYHEAIYWNNKILSVPKMHQHRLTVKNFCRVLEILIHYELENIDLMEARIRSVKRIFDQNKDKNALNLLIVENIKKIANEADPRSVFEEFETSLKNWNTEIAKPTGLEEITYWVRSKIERTSMAKVLEAELG